MGQRITKRTICGFKKTLSGFMNDLISFVKKMRAVDFKFGSALGKTSMIELVIKPRSTKCQKSVA